MEIIVPTEQLSKRLGGFIALDNLNKLLEQGEIFSLLGPKGDSGELISVSALMVITGGVLYKRVII